MCGIFGVVGDVPRELALACRDRLAHRGPDGAGLWAAPGVTLGHRRLSILDTSEGGSQPMAHPSGRYHMVYNGEVYNFVELRRELEALGERFSGASDSEVLLAAYARWGPACLERLNGMWALAVWDAEDHSLFLARDRFGKKPLFHAETPYGFAFASEMKALLPLLPSVEPNPDLLRSSRRIMSYEGGEECLIRGIRRFPAGHWGRLSGGRLRLTRWWNTLDHLVSLPRSHEERAELLRETFLDACRIRMRSDVPIGSALSGGLDSSAVTCALAHAADRGTTARAAKDHRHAFCAGFPGTPLDETPYARRVAEHLGIPLTVLELDPARNPGDLFEQMRLFEEYHLSLPLPFMRTYRAVKDHGISVSLDGHGADECFAGYLFHVVEALADAGLRPGAVRGIVEAFRRGRPASPQFPLPSPLALVGGYHRRRLAALLRGRAGVPSRDAGHPAWRRLDHLTRVLYQATHETILPTLLRNYDRYSMASGVEIRMPFMDHRVVALAFSMPWSDKVRGGYTKAVVRSAVSGFVPDDIAWRRTKIGFNPPVVDWMQGPLRRFLLDETHSAAFDACDLVDQDTARARLHAVLDAEQATYAQGEAAWTAIAPYFWEQAVIKGRA